MKQLRLFYSYFRHNIGSILRCQASKWSHVGNRVLLESEVDGLNLMLARLEESIKFQSAIPFQIKDPKHLITVC